MPPGTSFTDEIEQAALAYIEIGYQELDHTIPSVVGMSLALNVNKSTLYKWSDDGHGTFSDTLAKCNAKQHMMLLSKGLSGDYNAAITKLALSNHGYSEKTSTDITSGGEKIKNDWHIHPTTTEK